MSENAFERVEATARDVELNALDLRDKLIRFRDQLIDGVATLEDVENEAIRRGVLHQKETDG